jgi:hypothetical protein
MLLELLDGTARSIKAEPRRNTDFRPIPKSRIPFVVWTQRQSFIEGQLSTRGWELRSVGKLFSGPRAKMVVRIGEQDSDVLRGIVGIEFELQYM